MPQDNINPASDNNLDPARDGQEQERYLSDTQKIVQRHLEDEDHVITEDEMKSIRVGMTPPEASEKALEQLSSDKAVDATEKKIIGDTKDIEASKNERDGMITPWDTIEQE